MRELGVSDKLFFYNGSGEYMTANLREQVFFDNEPDWEMFREACEEVLASFEEFALRPVVKDNRIYMMENHEPFPLFLEGKDHDRCFGTEDTNGYLFYIYGKGAGIEVSWFHGLTDAIGMDLLLRSILFRYSEKTGRPVPKEQISEGYRIRLSGNAPSMPEQERMDPYRYYVEQLSLQKGAMPAPGDAYFIKRDRQLIYSNEVQVYEIHAKTKEFLALSKRCDCSFIALLVPMITDAIAAAFNVKEDRITAILPVDLRRIYDSATAVNFSDGITLPLSAKQRQEGLKEQARAVALQMEEKRGRAFLDTVLAGKVEMVEEFEGSGKPIFKMEPEPFVEVPPGVKPQKTYAVTYPGRLDFPEGTLDFVKSVGFRCTMSAGCAVVVYTFGEEMTVRLMQKNGDDAIAEAIVREFRTAGLSAEKTDEGRLKGDLLLLGRLQVV